MAKYHPHGNSAIYDALVRMAQPFSLRHPLIDFHGNYGSPDYGAAAERYTECRLLAAGHAAARRASTRTPSTSSPTTTATTQEPVVLPARFPNLLVNGSQGIAVGMATNIPPHNLGEVIDATIHLIDHPDATPDDLMQFVKGPDFPTGGLHPRPGRHHGRLPHRPRLDPDAGQGRDRGGRQAERPLPDRGHRAALPGRRRTPSLGRIKELVDSRRPRRASADANDSLGRHRTPGW